MTPSRGNGIIDTPSNHSVGETVEKLKGILRAKGVTLFALVDHRGEAEGGCSGKGLGHLQQPGLFRGAAPPAKGAATKHRGSRNLGGEGCRIRGVSIP
jgi:hypothetical protein